jgi:F-type H+-transporting ATPase subunit a
MFAIIALLTAFAVAPLQAQSPAAETPPVEHAIEAAQGETPAHAEEEGFDLIHHISDAREIETPFGVVHLPPAGSWQVGPVDMTPTKHVVFLGLSALILLAIFIPAGQAARRNGAEGTPRKGHNAVEALVLFFRDQVVMPNIGRGGERYVPFVSTLFFFILIANLLGLLPWGASATGNISVTAALAVMSFVVIEISGMRALGARGYFSTIVYIPHGLPRWMVPFMAVIMTPVEILGKLAKPFALAIRLFANMTAGHVVLLAIIGLIFLFGSYAIAVGPVLMAVALIFLELFVAFLQAYIFALLTSVFIGLIRHAH